MAVVLVKGGPRSLTFRKRLVQALARSCPFPVDGPGADVLDGEIVTKYYSAQLKYTTVEFDQEPEAIIAVSDGTDLESLLESPEKDMVKLFVTFEAEKVVGDDGVLLLAPTFDQCDLCLDHEFEHVPWSADDAPSSLDDDAQGLARLREALVCHQWSTAVMPPRPTRRSSSLVSSNENNSSSSSSAAAVVLVRGSERSFSFRRRLCEALASPAGTFPEACASTMDGQVQGDIKTKYYTAKVMYCVEEQTDRAPEAIIAVHDGTQIPSLLAFNGRNAVKLFLTFDSEHILGDDGSPLLASTADALEQCVNSGFEHLAWSTGLAPERSADAEGIWRLREALKCNMWSSAVMTSNDAPASKLVNGRTALSDPPEAGTTNNNEENPNNEGYTPPTLIGSDDKKTEDLPASEEEDALEKVMGNFDALAGRIRDAREYAARTDISDTDRRRHAADVAMELLHSLDESDDVASD
eukprot:GEMP01034334.1.p1 GENE.GEMP01034334.1~~GEMP01034334.1.p1  ORF type:complete len:467 (+),score=154.85 GEMP01034334.1:37-1437(+)